MRFAILGPLEAWADERQLALGGPQQRALLAALLLDANRVVSADRLMEYLWGERPPPAARRLLQGCVASLRRVLRTADADRSGQRLLTRPPGYLFGVRPGELDLDRFEELARAADGLSGEPSVDALARAAALRSEALSLWRGPALADIMLDTFRAEAAHLEERRLAVLEERIDAELRLGRCAGLVGELQAEIRAQPLRERLWAQLMLTLHTDDRQADALAAYRRLRQNLVSSLGVEPSPMLRELHRAILSGGDGLEVYLRARQGRAAVGSEMAELAASAPAGSLAGPSAGSAVAVPAQLPAATTGFTGRDRPLRQLDGLLAGVDGAMAIGVISGSAGIGKTALAVHWGHRVRRRFGDGQLYVDLRGFAAAPPMPPMTALTGFLLALGVPAERMPMEPEQAAALYRSLLADRRVLVVLDNAHSAEQVRPLLPGSAGCLVLVTSRERLSGLVARDGAGRIVLDVFSPAEAGALLTRILGRERVEAEPEATAKLAQACARLPLALRIAAANLNEQPERSIASYTADLCEGDRLGGLAVEGDEQTAVRAAFDLSYAGLDASAQRLFRLLGLVPGADVSVGAAAALIGDTAERAAGLLARLADAHLLGRPVPGRFAFHDLLRLYAIDRAHRTDNAVDRGAAAERLLDWYLCGADRAARILYPTMLRLPAAPAEHSMDFDGHAEALAWLDAERPNLVAATQHAAEHRPRRAAWLLADALRGYFWHRLYPVDWLTVARAGIAAAQADGDVRAQAAAQLCLADAYRSQSRHERAIEEYTTALRLSRRIGWLDGQATALGNVGNAYGQAGRLAEAADHFNQALAIDRRTGRLAGQTANLGNLGVVYRELGRLREAAEHHCQALALNRKLDSRGGEATDLSNLGEACRELGQLDQALPHLDRALSLHREVGDRGGEAETLRRLADAHCDLGRTSLALELAEAAVALARDTGERRYEADARNTLATVHLRLADHERAAEAYQHALRLARETETRYPEVVALVGLADLHQRAGDDAGARDRGHQALALAREGGYRVLEGHANTALADGHLAADQLEPAVKYAEEALAIHRSTGHRLGQARTLVLLGQALCGDDRAAAVVMWRQAYALFVAIGAPEADRVLALLRGGYVD